MDEKIKLELQSILGNENVKIQEPMKKHTTFRIGGEADYYVTPENSDHLLMLIKFCKERNIPYYIIGNGSNLLVGDHGYRGIIIEISKKISHVTIEKDHNNKVGKNSYLVTAESGIMLTKLAMITAEHGLTGFECESGIPGTLGGAVTMNAGAYGGEIKDFIVSAKVIDQSGQIKLLDKEALKLGYRTSIIQKKSYIILEASFLLVAGEKQVIQQKMSKLNQQRREKQPLEYASAGSTFKRPEGYYAGKLIMDAGLRGFRIGDVMISEKHCGFVVNVGNGTAKEVCTLIKEVDQKVYEQFKVHLEPEIKMIGEF